MLLFWKTSIDAAAVQRIKAVGLISSGTLASQLPIYDKRKSIFSVRCSNNFGHYCLYFYFKVCDYCFLHINSAFAFTVSWNLSFLLR